MSGKLNNSVFKIPNVDWEFVPEFKLKPMNGMEYYELINSGSMDDKGIFNAQGAAIILEYGIVSARNLEDGKKTSFKPLPVEDHAELPALWITHLAAEILSKSNLNGKERKN